MSEKSISSGRDWVSGRRDFIIAWGLPIAALIAANWIDPPLKTLLWSGALLWMGIACLANARRCGRVHCRFTGPFFLLMVVPVLLYGFGLLPLGADDWRWLGMTIGLGAGALWLVTEGIWGRYRSPGG